jgi:hypothetical protein
MDPFWTASPARAIGTTTLADLLQHPRAAQAVAVDLIHSAKERRLRLRELLRSGRGAGAAQPHPEPGWLQPPYAHTRRDPSRVALLTGRPKRNLAQTPCSRHHRPMPSPPPHLPAPSAHHRRADAHEPHRSTLDAHGTAGPRICQATASPAPAQDIARRILGNGWWAACPPATASPATAMGSPP